MLVVFPFMERKMKRLLQVTAMATVMAVLGFGPAMANEYEGKLKALAAGQLAAIAADPVVIKAVKAQNEAHAAFDAAKIDEQDKLWRAEAEKGGGAMTNALLANDASKLLLAKRDASSGVFAELFVMDNKGLNVGASNLTSDYMQGDEDKWQKTFQVGADAVLVDAVEQDESSGVFVSQVSVTVVDPETKAPIGALTAGVDVQKLP